MEAIEALEGAHDWSQPAAAKADIFGATAFVRQ